MIRYENAVALFEAGNYDDAVAGFIEIYESGFMCETIIRDIYNCFIIPNQEEFRTNFLHNNVGITSLDYEELPIDFIPVTEEKFYLFNREEKHFQGWIELGIEESERHFESVCIAGIWDLRDLFPSMKSGSWRKYYVNMENVESYFVSFLKLPNFTSDYLKDTVFFSSSGQMKQYFIENDEIYMPHIFCTNEDEKYRKIIQDVHNIRIQNSFAARKNIFLSICIPSWNRGSILLKTVRNLLNLKYDAEIEIVISNNGSDQDWEGYHELKDLGDSRIKYFEFERNQGYASNVRKVLELAEGDFAILASDEDWMLLDNFALLLDDLWNHSDMGIITTTGLGPGFANKRVINFTAGYEALSLALNLNYITGNTFNMELFHKNMVLSRFDAMRGNSFLEYYAHCVLAALTCEGAEARESGILLWDSKMLQEQEAPKKTNNRSGGISEYATLNSRLEQQNSSIELLIKALKLEPEELISLTMERMIKTYYVLSITCCNHVNEMLEEYHWIDICMILYKNNIALFEHKLSQLVKRQQFDVRSAMVSIFFRWYNRKKIMESLPEQERICEERLCRQIKSEYEAGTNLEEIDLSELRRLSVLAENPIF